MRNESYMEDSMPFDGGMFEYAIRKLGVASGANGAGV